VTTVAITGASSQLGTCVVDAVRALEGVDRVLAVDPEPPGTPPAEGVEPRLADPTDPVAVAAALAGADVVVHLAIRSDPEGDVDRERAVNVDGTRHVVAGAAAAGARKLVVGSSVLVYGAHPDNAVPLTEDAPLRATPDLPIAVQHREVDAWLADWAAEHPDVVVTRLRLATVVGRGYDSLATRAMLAPRLPSVRGHRPPFQFVHVDDAARAVAHAVAEGLPGAWNVAAEGWLSFDEVVAILGRRPLDLPEEVAFSTVERLGALGLSELPVGAVPHVMYPWVVSADRLVATGWRPEHSNRDAAALLAADLGDRLVVGPVRTTRRQVRRAAAVSAGVAGGLLALGLLGRRRDGQEDRA
jgi:UDP-glucose 4-epimerase